MLKLRDIMTTDVVTVGPDTTLRDAADLLARHHVSGCPVIEGGKVVGLVSASDILSFAAEQPGTPTERPVGADWGEWDELSPATEAESEDEPPGTWFTDLWSDVGEDVTERMAQVGSAEWNALDEHTVAEVMTRRLWRLGPDEDVERAVALMNARSVHRVIVMDGERLAGVVSTMDIARSVADHRLGARSYVFNNDRDFDGRGFE